MSQYSQAKDKPKRFLAMTGLTSEEFEALLPTFEACFYDWMDTYRLDGKLRGKRKYVDYKNSPLPTIEDKLYFILTYLKTCNLQEVHGALFSMGQPKANQWIHCLQNVLHLALDHENELPAREMADVQFHSEKDGIYQHDGTERPIQRPAKKADQKTYYSGKKKRHTVKNNLLINEHCRVLFLTETVEGKRHDKKLADESDYEMPPGSQLAQDSGFQGFKAKNVTILQPKKKPRNGELTDMEKNVNAWHSSIRIRVEHAIGGIKRYRIAKDTIRNWKTGFRDAVFVICCGLHNFRLRFRPWHYQPLQLHLFSSSSFSKSE